MAPRCRDPAEAPPPSFALYSGNDDSALALMLLGGHGVISVTANVAPRLMCEMCRAALAGDLARRARSTTSCWPLHLKLFVEPNPIPVKWALAKMGRIEGGIRLPLMPLIGPGGAVVLAALKEVGFV